MKVLKEILKEKLQAASSFLKSSITSSAVSGVLLEGSKKGLEIYSTNLSSFYSSTIPLSINQPFSLVVEPKKIIEVLSVLDTEEIELEVKEKKLVIKTDKAKTEFSAMEVSDYPKPPKIQKKASVFAEEIIEKLPLVLFSAAVDDSRPILTGVNFAKKEGELLMVTTDGFRLSLVKTKGENLEGLQEGEYVVPADFLRVVLREMRRIENIGFSYDEKEKLIYFSIGQDEYFSRLIEGDFPPYEKVIPSNFSTEVVLDHERFLRNIKLASIFAKDYSNVILFEVRKDGIYILPRMDEAAAEAQTFQEGEVKGEEVKVAFNFKFVVELLNNVKGERVKVKIVRSDAPVVFEIEGRENFLHIIMPIRISE